MRYLNRKDRFIRTIVIKGEKRRCGVMGLGYGVAMFNQVYLNQRVRSEDMWPRLVVTNISNFVNTIYLQLWKNNFVSRNFEDYRRELSYEDSVLSIQDMCLCPRVEILLNKFNLSMTFLRSYDGRQFKKDMRFTGLECVYMLLSQQRINLRSFSLVRNRCKYTEHSRGIGRVFHLFRGVFRGWASFAHLFGVRRSSW